MEKHLLQVFSFFKCLTTNFVSIFFFRRWMMFFYCRKNRRWCQVPYNQSVWKVNCLMFAFFCSTLGKQDNHQMDLVFNKFEGIYIVEEKSMLFGTWELMSIESLKNLSWIKRKLFWSFTMSSLLTKYVCCLLSITWCTRVYVTICIEFGIFYLYVVEYIFLS